MNPASGRDVDLSSLPAVLERVGEWAWLSAFVREQIGDPATVDELLS